MINECRIETMDQLSSLVSEQIYRPELKRHRDLHVYRGMERKVCNSKDVGLDYAGTANFLEIA